MFSIARLQRFASEGCCTCARGSDFHFHAGCVTSPAVIAAIQILTSALPDAPRKFNPTPRTLNPVGKSRLPRRTLQRTMTIVALPTRIRGSTTRRSPITIRRFPFCPKRSPLLISIEETPITSRASMTKLSSITPRRYRLNLRGQTRISYWRMPTTIGRTHMNIKVSTTRPSPILPWRFLSNLVWKAPTKIEATIICARHSTTRPSQT